MVIDSSLLHARGGCHQVGHLKLLYQKPQGDFDQSVRDWFIVAESGSGDGNRVGDTANGFRVGISVLLASSFHPCVSDGGWVVTSDWRQSSHGRSLRRRWSSLRRAFKLTYQSYGSTV